MEKPGPGEPPPTYAGQAPVYPPGPQPTQATVTTVIVTPGQLPPTPTSLKCPNCQSQIITQVVLVNGILVWISVGVLILVGCWLGCCLIPLFIDDLKDVEHRCPQCNAYIGTRKRL